MIKAIIFDCFGVLTTDRWLEFCASLPEGPVRQGAHQLNYEYNSGRITLDDFIDKVQKLTGKDLKVLEEIFTSPIAAKNIPLIEFIRTLKPDYKIGILSNVANNWVREVLLSEDEQKLFDAMVFSYEVGTGKPDPIMYKTVLDKLDVEPEEAIFIDDLEKYCEAAQDLGMEAIKYENFTQMKGQLEGVLAAVPNN